MARPWRCSKCKALLGINESGSLSVRHKKAQYIIDGKEFKITTACRRCAQLNQLVISKDKAK